MSVTPNSIITPQMPQAAVGILSTTANTTYGSVPTNTVQVLQAGPAGGRLTKLNVIPQGTVTATQVQLFRSTNSGTNKIFTNSALISAYTMAQTTQAPQTPFGYSDANPLILAPNEILYLATGVGGVPISFEAEWANY